MMNISIFRSRSGLRYYLIRGVALSLCTVLLAFAGCVWSVYRTGKQTLPPSVRADAAVVLGAAAWDKRPSPVFRERINHAIALYQSGQVGKLVFTGGSPKKGFMTEAQVGRRYALKQGIPAHDIFFENTSRDTYQNLYNIQPLLRMHSIDSIIIVSDPYHLARAQAIAEDLGLKAQISATPTSRYIDTANKAKFLLQESYSLFAYYGGSRFEKLWSMVTR
ncbi:Periplasmic protein [Neisseria weaveri]|uniref:Periplasmic protein n=2 Tax=Neisseria weaveri TaxID=28091 RepID=A0A3S5C457_9NEIS|nr:periplasmic protein [Neisseria weaveri ATCC 51223]EGV36715.1 periplasmic protein [Neisseria weaveri LMG 5135]SAY51861.1 Periplasmic protein [Neisseria weaveri]VEJ51283.1 Periplasmic protein [Neisseria weaveri]